MAGLRYNHRLRDAAAACLVLLSCAVALGGAQEEGSVRLSGGTHPLQGFLEVFLNGEWGTVCGRQWGEEDANVVCKQIGALDGAMLFESTRAFTAVEASLPIHMSKVECKGTEAKITDCTFQNKTNGCSHARDVKIDCIIPGYKACVNYHGQKAPLTGKRHDPAEKSITECSRLCRTDGYHYAGLTEDACLCGSAGDKYEEAGVVPNSECGSKCLGAASQNCGANGKLAVHEVMAGSCSGIVRAKKGSIVSPGFPGAYPQDGRECQWVVDVTDNGDTAVEFTVFKLAANDSIQISTNDGKNWTKFMGTDYKQDKPPKVPTFDSKKLMVKFSIGAKSVQSAEHLAFVMIFRDDTTCEVIEFPNGSLDVVEGTSYRPGDKVDVLCDRNHRNKWQFVTCNEDGIWRTAPECAVEPRSGNSLIFTQTYLFMMLAAIGALGLIFFMVICGVICVGRKKKKEGYTGISRQESAEPTKVDHEYVDMREGSDLDMQHVGAHHEDQSIPLASGAMDE